MRPVLSMASIPEAVLPGEPFELVLTLRNPTDDELPAPLPTPDWWRGTRLWISRPDGSKVEFRLSDAPAEENGERLTIFDGAELAKSISLPVSVPGQYSAEGLLATSEGDEWAIPAAQWFVEKPQPMEAAVLQLAGAGEQDALSCWMLVRGERRSALAVRSLLRNDESRRERLQLTSAMFLREVDSVAHGLVAMEALDEPPHSAQWVAWLSGRAFHAGVAFALFETTSLTLTREPGRILPHLLHRPDGGADAVVLAGDGAELWWLRIPAPEWIEEMDKPPDDGEFPHPSDRVKMRAPEIVGSIALPGRIAAMAVSTGGADVTAVVGLAQNGSSVDVHYAVLSPAGSRPRWTCARIDQAWLIAGADPSLAIDERGSGRVAVLVRVPGHEPQVGVVVVAFDRDGQPLWTEGAGRRHYPLRAAAVHGAIALRFHAGTREWLCHWYAMLDGGGCVRQRGSGEVEEVALQGKLLTSLSMAVWVDECGVACQTEEGWLRFAC